MPTTYVSGGGSALQDALLDSISTSAANQDHTFIIEDGIYSPISFNTWLSGWKNSIFLLSSRNGAENCIIDGGAVWEYDSTGYIWNATRLSGGSRCITANSVSPSYFNLSCVGICFRNAYSSSNNATVAFNSYSGKYFYNCRFENIYCASNAAIGSYNIASNCVFKNIYASRFAIAATGTIDKCAIDSISCNTLYETSIINRSVLSHISCRSMSNYSNGFRNNLVYDFYFSYDVFSSNRGDVRGNTFVTASNARSKAFSIGNNYNQNNSLRRIDNNIFVGNCKLYGAVLTTGVSVVTNNNFCRAVNDVSCYNCITGTDPYFVDEANNDYHLAANSPCISTGNWSLRVYARDLDNMLYKDPPSMGAYEYYKALEGEIPNYINPVGQRKRAPWSEIEYVQTIKNKTATIDTGIVPNGADTSFEVKFNNMNAVREGNKLRSVVDQTISGVRSWFGFNNNRSSDQIGIYTGRTVNGISTSSGNGSNASYFYNKDYTQGPYIGKYDAQLSSITIKAVGANQTSTMQVTNAECQPFTSTWRLFYGIDTGVGPELRFYYLKIWKSGVLVRDFIPFRVGNVGYLFDKVTRKLFANKGTGAFILGPDKN